MINVRNAIRSAQQDARNIDPTSRACAKTCDWRFPLRHEKIAMLLGVLGGLSVFLLSLSASSGAICASQPASGTQDDRISIKISRDTTYFLGPLRPDGMVDYVAALNQRYGKGVTKKNNAAVLLIEAVGPSFVDAPIRKQVLAHIGLADLRADGEYFIPWESFSGGEKDVSGQLDKAMEGPWSSQDHPRVAAWLEANEGPLAKATRASRLRSLFIPWICTDRELGFVACDAPVRGPYETTVPIGNALSVRALWKLQCGKLDDALSDVLTIHRLARLLEQGPGAAFLVTAAGHMAAASDAGNIILSNRDLTSQQAKWYLKQLHSLPSERGLADAYDVQARCFMLEAIVVVARRGPSAIDAYLGRKTGSRLLGCPAPIYDWSRYARMINWNYILRYANRQIDRWVAQVRGCSYREMLDGLEAIETKRREEVDAIVGRFLRSQGIRDSVDFRLSEFLHWLERDGSLRTQGPAGWITECFGKYLLYKLGPHFSEELAELITRKHMAFDTHLVAAALVAYRAEHGEYPDTLEALTPDYLGWVPRDRFTGRELTYRRRGRGDSAGR